MIEVTLLGKFEFIVNGKNAESVLSSSRKGTQMLSYLILNDGKSVSSANLYEALWPNDSSANPESALKTLVSRLRSALSAFDEDLSKCIATDHGAYRWDGDGETNVDALRFERLCEKLLASDAISDELSASVDQILSVYCGDLFVCSEDDKWFVSRRAYYHGLYMKAVLYAINLYKDKGDYDRVMQICRTALDVDAFEEQLHIELMDALVKTNRNSEALAQYRHVTNLHYSYLGMPPSENLQNFYKQITRADQLLGMDIDTIRKTLEESESRSGAFVCEYSIFRDVYQLQMRNLQRLGTTMYIAIVMLSPASQRQVEPFALDKAMHQLLNTMISCLRKGDTITRYSPSQFALLLPSVNASTGHLVIKRIRAAYYGDHVNPALAFSYKLAPVAPYGK